MTPDTAILGFLMLGMTLYALLAGADFGAGVWEFNTGLRATKEEHELLYRAIGPVWEANHVWLIFVVTGLFTAFPPAFAGLSRALWIPFLLAVVGIVFRGVAYVFRSAAEGPLEKVWGAVFAFASAAAPFFLGASAGAAASGKLAITADGGYVGNPLTDWIRPQSIHGAVFGVAACAYIAAVYLARECATRKLPQLEMWRRRAILSGLWLGLLSIAGILVMKWDSPLLWNRFSARSWPIFGASAAAGFLSIALLWKRRFVAATISSGLSLGAVIWAWGIAQYPVLVLPEVTVESAHAPASVMKATLWSAGIGLVLVAPSLAWLFALFKGTRDKS